MYFVCAHSLCTRLPSLCTRIPSPHQRSGHQTHQLLHRLPILLRAWKCRLALRCLDFPWLALPAGGAFCLTTPNLLLMKWLHVKQWHHVAAQKNNRIYIFRHQHGSVLQLIHIPPAENTRTYSDSVDAAVATNISKSTQSWYISSVF